MRVDAELVSPNRAALLRALRAERPRTAAGSADAAWVRFGITGRLTVSAVQRVRVNVDVAPCRAFAGKLPRRALTNARVADLVKQTGCLRRSTAARVEERVGALTIAAHVWRWTSRATIPNGLATDAGPFAALFVPTAGDPATPAVCGVGQHFETDLAATRAGRAADSRTADLRRLTERARIDLTLHIGATSGGG